MIRMFILALLLLWAPVAMAADVAVGDQVVLRAQHPLGVPLHREPHPSLLGRGLDGAEAKVLRTEQDARWAQIEISGGPTAWALSRYLTKRGGPAGGTPPAGSDSVASPIWSSPDECRTRVTAGERLQRPSDAVRLVSWNIRFFPNSGTQTDEIRTDLGWLACVLAWMQPDVIAVQEIRATRQADFAWASVFDGLETTIGGNWRVDLQECGGEAGQHVGFVWNADRVALSEERDVWQLNGAASGPSDACARNLRPGRAAYLKSLNGGVDAHIVSVHTDSGTTGRDFDHREVAFKRLDSVFSDLNARTPDADIIVLGDMNTMGAVGRVDADTEIRLLGEIASREAPEYRHLAITPRCTEYFEQACGWLDHVLIARNMREASLATARVTGYCALTGGAAITGPVPAAYERLSDHCPVVVDVKDVDQD